MKNKILVNVFVPRLQQTYDVYIPVNERISRIGELLEQAICELSDDCFDLEDEHCIIEMTSGYIYTDEVIIRDTTIKNGTKIIFF